MEGNVSLNVCFLEILEIYFKMLYMLHIYMIGQNLNVHIGVVQNRVYALINLKHMKTLNFIILVQFHSTFF